MTGLRNDSPCYVYGLLDPRSDTIFYVGVTAHPDRRIFQHKVEKARCQEIISSGLQPQLVVLHKCTDRNQALRLEHCLLAEYPALINRARYFTQVSGKYAGRSQRRQQKIDVEFADLCNRSGRPIPPEVSKRINRYIET